MLFFKRKMVGERMRTKEKLVKGKVWCMVNYNEIYIVL